MNLSSASKLRDYEISSVIGEGAFAKVYKAIRIRDNRIFALKKCRMNSLRTHEQATAFAEASFLASVQHPCVIQFEDAMYDEVHEELSIIMEYAPSGDLLKLVKSQANRRRCPSPSPHLTINEGNIWKWAVQILEGLLALHDKRIIHRDLKCENVFLDAKGNAKIGDLNVATHSATARNQGTAQVVGTPYYTAPEVYEGSGYDEKSDVWSFGCLLYELCALRPPFQAKDAEQLKRKVFRGIYDEIPAPYSRSLADIIAACIQVNRKNRSDLKVLISTAQKEYQRSDFQADKQVKRRLSTLQQDDIKDSREEFTPKQCQENIRLISDNHSKVQEDMFTGQLVKQSSKYRQNSQPYLREKNRNEANLRTQKNLKHVDEMLEREIQRRLDKLNQKDHGDVIESSILLERQRQKEINGQIREKEDKENKRTMSGYQKGSYTKHQLNSNEDNNIRNQLDVKERQFNSKTSVKHLGNYSVSDIIHSKHQAKQTYSNRTEVKHSLNIDRGDTRNQFQLVDSDDDLDEEQEEYRRLTEKHLNQRRMQLQRQSVGGFIRQIR